MFASCFLSGKLDVFRVALRVERGSDSGGACALPLCARTTSCPCFPYGSGDSLVCLFHSPSSGCLCRWSGIWLFPSSLRTLISVGTSFLFSGSLFYLFRALLPIYSIIEVDRNVRIVLVWRGVFCPAVQRLQETGIFASCYCFTQALGYSPFFYAEIQSAV